MCTQWVYVNVTQHFNIETKEIDWIILSACAITALRYVTTVGAFVLESENASKRFQEGIQLNLKFN